jgi:hypothetical protein
MNKVEPGKLYTLEELSNLFQGKITAAGIRSLIHRGALPAMRLGQRKLLVCGADAIHIMTPLEEKKYV